MKELKKGQIYLYDSAESYLEINQKIEKKDFLILNLDFISPNILFSKFSLKPTSLEKMSKEKVIIIGNLSYFNLLLIEKYFFFLPLSVLKS